jgi:isoamylase
MRAGGPSPLGATRTPYGMNFSIFSAHARTVQLLLFESEDAPRADRVIQLDPVTNHTGHYWHVELPDILHGQVYAYRADGAHSPGYVFDGDKVLIDPYAKAVSTRRYDRMAASRAGDNESSSMRSVVVDLELFDWEGDQPLRLPFRETVIYELHVGGFTRHPNSGLAQEKRGTYAGVVAKIPYLQELGVTAVELMPIFQFDSQDAPRGLENYWGYSPVSFFAAHVGYSSSGSPTQCLDEFRNMVKALHRAGIEVILDVVYNHTAEDGSDGPTFCFKGLDNPMYYILSEDRHRFADFTGAGNTLNTNQSVVRRLVIDSLRHWVSDMHVDGFRFDLASVLSRDVSGKPQVNAPVIWDIDSDPVLAGTKLMAEAWDAGGLYQVGSFSKDRWKEWNGRFRDHVRSFLKSDRGSVRNLRQRLMGSPDMYTETFHPPEQSINFITCHDGFTLNDLFSFDTKHNEQNREDNHDGESDNRSWNCGVEGPTSDPGIESLRERQIRNAVTLNLISIGTPLLLMGDEVRRTQNGNNNAYCQNNETSWFDWNLCSRNAGLRRFVSLLIRMRRHFGSAGHGRSMSLRELLDHANIDWHGVNLHSPDFSEDSHTLAVAGYMDNGLAFHLMLNAYWEPLHFAIPSIPANAAAWYRIIDTAQPSPLDFLDRPIETIRAANYLLQPRSIVLLGAASKEAWADVTAATVAVVPLAVR